jgi:hypothetical protein
MHLREACSNPCKTSKSVKESVGIPYLDWQGPLVETVCESTSVGWLYQVKHNEGAASTHRGASDEHAGMPAGSNGNIAVLFITSHRGYALVLHPVAPLRPVSAYSGG